MITTIKKSQHIEIICVFNEYSLVIKGHHLNPLDVSACYITPYAVYLVSGEKKVRIPLTDVRHMISGEYIDNPDRNLTENHQFFYESLIAEYYLDGKIPFEYESYMVG